MRFYLVSHPQSLADDPRRKRSFDELAVSAGDGIGLNSVTSNHTAHVTLNVFDKQADVPAEVLEQQPRYWFESTSREIAVTDTEGIAALIARAPGLGRIACVVECSGREETNRARHHEHDDDVRDVERWRIAAWPEAR
jgi:hypothetical protein